MMPKISIIIPIYNVEKYLKECLDSVINQTLKDIEIICVNDGSTDSSAAILEEYAARDNRIKLINKQNSGYGDSMNKGLEIATGEYIGIVESDDYIKPEMYETLYGEAKKNDVDIVKSNFNIIINKRGKRCFIKVILDKTNQFFNKKIKPMDNLEVFTFPMYTWSGIYKREFLNKNNIRHNTTPGASFQDNGFFFQTFTLADSVYFLNQEFYYYRCDNPNASCKQAYKNNIIKSQKEYEFINNFIQQHPELMPKIYYVYNWQKLQMYLAWYDTTVQDIWIDIAHKEFKSSFENKEIDFSLYNEERTKYLKTIINNPSKFSKLFFKTEDKKISIFKKLFSVSNEYVEDKKIKVVRILFLKFRIKKG